MAKPLTISQQDILRGKTVTPGWYPATIKDVTDVVATSTGVEGWKVTFIIDKEPFQGVPVEVRYWENAPGFSAPLVAVLKGVKTAEAGTYDLSNAIGKKLMIYVTNGKWQNRLTNQVEDFRPLGS